ncbi:MAG: DUF342 domain-containing protein [Nitrospirae bacterium]|nr:DUF342 domain-containing protein [Nitrospirota bacterium]
MKKIRIREAQIGQTLAEDIVDLSRGSNFSLLMKRGVVLSREHIEKLEKYGVCFLYVEVPAGQKSSPGETYEYDAVTADIISEGNVVIKCAIPPYTKIDAGKSVVIKGNISEGCIVASKKGGVSVRGEIRGTRDSLVKIISFQDLSIHSHSQHSITFADMIAEGDIKIVGGIADSAVSCKGELKIDGRAERSQLYSQSRIRVFECGDEIEKDTCMLMVRPFECDLLAQELLKIDSKLSEFAMERQKMESVVELIRRLGKGVSRLSEDKKMNLAAVAKRYQEIERESALLLDEKSRVTKEIENMMSVRRIIVSGGIYPGVKVSVRNLSRVIMKKKSSVAFFVKDNKVDVAQI